MFLLGSTPPKVREIKTVVLTASAGQVEFIDGTDGVVLDTSYRTYLLHIANMTFTGNPTTIIFKVSINAGGPYASTNYDLHVMRRIPNAMTFNANSYLNGGSISLMDTTALTTEHCGFVEMQGFGTNNFKGSWNFRNMERQCEGYMNCAQASPIQAFEIYPGAALIAAGSRFTLLGIE